MNSFIIRLAIYYVMLNVDEELEELVKSHLQDIERVLDIGAGNLRVSKHFAGKAEVDAFNKREYDIDKEDINWIQADMMRYVFKKTYDLIAASFSLQYLTPKEAARMIPRIKHNTRDNG